MGILEKIKIFNRRMYPYYHASPVADLYYYLDAKYGYTEGATPREQLVKTLRERMPHHIEQFMANLLAKTLGLYREKTVEKGWEVDIALTDYQRLRVIAEVKWKISPIAREIQRIEEELSKYRCQKILIVPNKEIIDYRIKDIDLGDVNTILNIRREGKID